MTSVASKNLFELLGNTEDGDENALPVIPVEKAAARKGKRDGPGEAPVAAAPPAAPRGGGRGGRGGRRNDATGSERAFQDRDAGRTNNRDKPVDDGLRRDRHSNTLEGGRIQRGPGYDGRGGRGGMGGRRSRGGRDDRHSRTGISEHPKQAEKGWGEDTAEGELKDEKAAQADALEEEKTGFDSTADKPVNAEGETPATEAEPEPEDKSKSYGAYLAELAEKKLALGGSLTARQANEGSKLKIPEGHQVERDEEASYMAGTGAKAARIREKKDKNFLTLDHDMIARESAAPRGGARGGRGGRGRGDGARRGSGRGGAPRGEYRGGRGGSRQNAPSIGDSSAFPSLGA